MALVGCAAAAVAEVYVVPGVGCQEVARVATAGEDSPHYPYNPDCNYGPVLVINTNGGRSEGWIAISNGGDAKGAEVAISNGGNAGTIAALAVSHGGDAEGNWQVSDTGNVGGYRAQLGVSGTGSVRESLVAISGTGSASGGLAISGTGDSCACLDDWPENHTAAVSGTGNAHSSRPSLLSAAPAGDADGGYVTVGGRNASGDIAVAGTGDAHSSGPACVAVIGDCYGGDVIGLSVLGASHA
jgi:hypothetical protein